MNGKLFFAMCLNFIFLNQIHSQYRIKGKITDENGKELEGVSIQLDGNFKTQTSNSSGEFEIENLKNDKQVIRAFLSGYKLYTDTLFVSENKVLSIELKSQEVLIDEVMVQSTRVDEKSGMAYSTVSKEELEKINLGQDLPILLNSQTSVVTTSDAGAGVGYTGLRIRGTDGTRINITINGVPINDAESQGVFWVNMPDIVSSTNSLQIQRGVGTSTNGAGAFGASINLLTNTLNEKPYAEFSSSGGSFQTFKNTFQAGTGLLNGHWAFDGRISSIQSEGYIQRASSRLFGYYFSGGYYGKKTVLKGISFSGSEKTYQAWYGIHKDSLKKDRTQNTAGMIVDSQGRIRYYENETDNYKQDNYQIHLLHSFSNKLNFNAAFHYTKGRGYYEQYKQNESFYDYGLEPILQPDSSIIDQSDLIRRLWLDNDFTGAVYSLNYKPNNRFTFTFGGGNNQYVGFHFGEIVWARNSSSSEIRDEFYRDKAIKLDHNVYLKGNLQLTPFLYGFLDLQFRNVDYAFRGPDNNFIEIDQKANYQFFNPKAGITALLNENNSFYSSFSVANKEPNRDDFVQSTPSSRPTFETLYDYEMGFRSKMSFMNLLINLYHMDYKNQLVLTGEINNVGAYNRSNVKTSYRRGIELETSFNLTRKINLSLNATFSQNHIKNYSQFIDDYDNGTQIKLDYKLTHIAFSPNTIAGANLQWKPLKGLEFNLMNKYVGIQFLDNTTEVKKSENNFLPSSSIDPYFITDLVANYFFETKKIKSIGFQLKLNNIFNVMYSANGYAYSYVAGGNTITESFYYPQAGFNFMAGVNFKF